MAKMTFPGMAAFGRELDRLERVANELESSVPSFDDLFPPLFMREHTRFGSWRELFRFGGFCVEAVEDLDRVSAQKLDSYVSDVTVFRGFQQMLDAGYAAYADRMLRG